MNLHTTAPEIYRTLIEATAFGALMIINRIESCGVKINEVINCGGIAVKSPLAMQIYADVCNRPMKISSSSQTCALGAAITGAVAGGAFPNVAVAQQKLCNIPKTVYKPERKNVAVYKRLFALYQKLHDSFGTQDYSSNLFDVMKSLIVLRK
jgi:L-ribulokinase